MTMKQMATELANPPNGALARMKTRATGATLPTVAQVCGDGLTDIAVFRPSTGTWMIKDQYIQTWGAAGDVPVPLDRNGDGRAELGVFRRATFSRPASACSWRNR